MENPVTLRSSFSLVNASPTNECADPSESRIVTTWNLWALSFLFKVRLRESGSLISAEHAAILLQSPASSQGSDGAILDIALQQS